jgi:hypothetical protein
MAKKRDVINEWPQSIWMYLRNLNTFALLQVTETHKHAHTNRSSRKSGRPTC